MRAQDAQRAAVTFALVVVGFNDRIERDVRRAR